MQFETDADLILDGGNSPALSFTDQTIYDQVSQKFADAVSDGSLPSANLTGLPMTTFTDSSGDPVDLPIFLQPSYNSDLNDLTSLYTQLVAKGNELQTTATEVEGALGTTYGAPGSPVSIYMHELSTNTNKTIVGYGTLVVGPGGLQLSTGIDMTWNGDIFVLGNSGNESYLEANSRANLVVNGNLIILGEGLTDTRLELNSGATATVNGSLFFGTDWADSEKLTRSSLEINGGSQLTVNGLLTLVGPTVEMEFEVGTTVPNPLNTISITGMMQIAVPSNLYKPNKLRMELQGNSAIYKDDAMIQQGVDTLQNLGVEYSMPMVNQLIDTGGFTTFSWQRLSN